MQKEAAARPSLSSTKGFSTSSPTLVRFVLIQLDLKTEPRQIKEMLLENQENTFDRDTL